MPGPPQKPDSQRRRRNLPLGGSFTYLPASGRKGKPPPWPLPTPTARELDVWRRLWRLPQAVAWEPMGYFGGLARYVRLSVLAETKPTGVLLSEARQEADRWGLSPLSAQRLRWQIVALEPQESSDVVDIRHRLRAREKES